LCHVVVRSARGVWSHLRRTACADVHQTVLKRLAVALDACTMQPCAATARQLLLWAVKIVALQTDCCASVGGLTRVALEGFCRRH